MPFPLLAGSPPAPERGARATTARSRRPWRHSTRGTALLAASVIVLFEASIHAVATLAVVMPIVASMGGIGTTQTATVVVRGLAVGDLTHGVLRRVLMKELWLGKRLVVRIGDPIPTAGKTVDEVLLSGERAVAALLPKYVEPPGPRPLSRWLTGLF